MFNAEANQRRMGYNDSLAWLGLAWFVLYFNLVADGFYCILPYNQIGRYCFIISTGFELAEHVHRLAYTEKKQKLWQRGETLAKNTYSHTQTHKNEKQSDGEEKSYEDEATALAATVTATLPAEIEEE